MTRIAVTGVLGVAANPLLQQLNAMQFPQGSNMGQMPQMQQQMDPNMAAMLYQQQMMAQQQANGNTQQLIAVAEQNEQLMQEREQLIGMIQQQNQMLEEAEHQVWMAQNPDLLDPVSVDRALCLSASADPGVWFNMRERLNNVMGKTVSSLPLDQARKLLDNVLQQFSAPDNNADTCGMGVLSIHLLNAISMEDTEESKAALVFLFDQYQPLADPVLTLLLDMPWNAVLQSKWPLFPLLSQVHHRKNDLISMEEIDGLNHTATKKYWTELSGHLGRRDWNSVRDASEKFMDKYSLETTQVAMLTAFAGQGMNTNSSFRDICLEYTQEYFKRMVVGGGDLDAVVGSKWPMFEVLQGLWDSNALNE